jgi:hypothetical protein
LYGEDFRKCNNPLEKPNISIYSIKFRNFVIKKLLPQVRLKMQFKSIKANQSIIVIKGENVFEVKGVYLYRYMLKEFRKLNFNSFTYQHRTIIFLIVLVPQYAVSFYFRIFFSKIFYGTSIVFLQLAFILLLTSAFVT